MPNLERQPIGNLLLRGLHRGYAELVNEVAVADRREPARIDSETGWSLRDHLAHVAAWEAIELARAEGRSGLPEHFDMLAEVAFRRRRGGPLAEAMERFTQCTAGSSRCLPTCPRPGCAGPGVLPTRTRWRPTSPGKPTGITPNTSRRCGDWPHRSRNLPSRRQQEAADSTDPLCERRSVAITLCSPPGCQRPPPGLPPAAARGEDVHWLAAMTGVMTLAAR